MFGSIAIAMSVTVKAFLVSVFVFQSCVNCNFRAEDNIDLVIRARIDELIESFLPTNHVPGLSLSITQNNQEVLYRAGYGLMDIENNKPTDSNTLFGIGSISKSFTATVVARTLHELFPEYGDAAVDLPIRELLPPGLNFTLGDRYRSESSSFRDLLSHRTCLKPEVWGLTVGAAKTESEFIYRERYASEQCPFRTNMVYNNGVVEMAGEYIALIANTTFGAMLEKLFMDLGMTSTTFIKQSDDFPSMQNLSKLYYFREDQLHIFNSELLKKVSVAPGSGGILSNANDMAIYTDFHINYGKVGDKQIVPGNVMKWLHQPSIPLPFTGFRTNTTDVVFGDYAYGMGLFLGVYDGWEYSRHSGYLPSYLSLMTLFPAFKLGIFTSSNGPGDIIRQAGPGLDGLHRDIFQILTEDVEASVKPRKKHHLTVSALAQDQKQSKTKIRTYAMRKAPEDLIGMYGNGHSGDLIITFKNGTGANDTGLYCDYGTWGTGFLRETAEPNIYSMDLDSDLIQEAYASGVDSYRIQADFNRPNVVLMSEGGADSTSFEKDVTLEMRPVIPWDPDSCGPELTL